jgi:hypothetical protein
MDEASHGGPRRREEEAVGPKPVAKAKITGFSGGRMEC